ncbi:MAG: hypothetical protein NTU44_14260, partial [Bacteroidetes bacterium]|nr:hypothetical protein [Bacteroidota bacterium]
MLKQNKHCISVQANSTYGPVGFDPLHYVLHESDKGLYNGNIAQIWSNQVFLSNTDPNYAINTYNNVLLYRYSYDRLQRLMDQEAHTALLQLWGTPTINFTENYFNSLTYDAAGNIQYLLRKAPDVTNTPALMDNLIYHYYTNTNRLEKITEDQTIPDNAFAGDLDQTAGTTANYTYDATGNLIGAISDSINLISWNIAGKPDSIHKNTIPAVGTRFFYDPGGNRVAKSVDTLITIYVRDAQGNVISVYSKSVGSEVTDTALYQQNVYLYGSARLGW